MTLTAYMAAKIGIKEYLMKKFLKIYYHHKDKILRWKFMPKKSALIDWTSRTRWNSGEEHPEGDLLSLAWHVSPPPLSSQPTPQEWTVYLHWFCPLKHLRNPQTTSFTRPILLLWGITEPFVLGDEMPKSGGLVRFLTPRSQLLHCHVLNRLPFLP